MLFARTAASRESSIEMRQLACCGAQRARVPIASSLFFRCGVQIVLHVQAHVRANPVAGTSIWFRVAADIAPTAVLWSREAAPHHTTTCVYCRYGLLLFGDGDHQVSTFVS